MLCGNRYVNEKPVSVHLRFSEAMLDIGYENILFHHSSGFNAELWLPWLSDGIQL